MIRLLFSCFLVLILCGKAYSETVKPVVILLSIDGFAYEYLHKYQPPNMLALSKSGIKAKLQSVYPSKTFPNHLSIITGSYPIHHGITNNAFYSPEIKQQYRLGAGKNNAAWLKADPLWVLAEQHDIKSAVYFWPESEALDKQPTYNIGFNTKDSNEKRFAQLLQWLMLPSEQQPQLIVSYFSIVDSAGHTYGPNSNEVKQAINDIDFLIGDFVAKIATEVPYEVNLIIVSDHGMMQTDKSKLVKPSQVFDASILNLIKNNVITVSRNDTQIYLYFTQPNLDELKQLEITQRLKKQAETDLNKHLYTLYTKGNYPKNWQLVDNNTLVPDIIFEATPPATFVKENIDLNTSNNGTHGYDPINQKGLLGIFLATGPDILKSKEILLFENIHVFPFITDLLTIPPPANIDGTGEMLKPYLKK